MKAMFLCLPISICFLFIMNGLQAQEDCILGVGITDDQTLIDIFHLNGTQSEKLINFSAELKYRNELLNNQAGNILKRHPQGSTAEIIALAKKYNVIWDSVIRVQRAIDIRTLKLFNKNQYMLYIDLCEKAFRRPYHIIPKIYRDSIPPK